MWLQGWDCRVIGAFVYNVKPTALLQIDFVFAFQVLWEKKRVFHPLSKPCMREVFDLSTRLTKRQHIVFQGNSLIKGRMS